MKKIFLVFAVAFAAFLVSCGGKGEAADPMAAYETALNEAAAAVEKTGELPMDLGQAIDDARAAARTLQETGTDEQKAKFSELEAKFWSIMTPLLNEQTKDLNTGSEEEAPADTVA